MSALMVASDGHCTAITIGDISAKGFRIEHLDDLKAGDDVVIVLPKGERIPARIQWSVGREAGGVFLSDVSASLG
jgi:hypothetical protein